MRAHAVGMIEGRGKLRVRLAGRRGRPQNQPSRLQPPYPPQPVDPSAEMTSPDPYGNLESQPTPAPLAATPPAAGSYPFASRTTNPNQVLSPYEPYNVIDVEGFKSGTLARDPSNQKIFRVP